MSAPRFTAGPWRFATYTMAHDVCSVYGVETQPTEDGLGQGWVYIVHEQDLGDTSNERREQQTANAHLIAASPDLYAALEAMVSEYPKPSLQTAVAARAALARARGETL